MEADAEFFDAYMSLVGKATVWAARRDRPLWITGVELAAPAAPTDAEIPPIFPEEYVEQMRDSSVRQPFTPYNVTFNQAADGTYDVRVQVRQPGRDRFAIYERPLQLKKGDTSYPVVLDLGTGTHFVDAWLLEKGRVVDWHTSVVEVGGWPSFDNLKLSKTTVLPNDTLDVSFDIQPPLSEQIYEQRGLGCGIMLRAVDGLHRIVATAMRHVPPTGGHIEMSITFADLVARRLKIEVYVIEAAPFLVNETREFNETELGRAAYDFRHVSVRSVGAGSDFAFVYRGDASAEYNVRDSYRRLSSMGVDMLCADGEAGGFYAGEANLQSVPRLTSYRPAAGDNFQETPCLTDPAYLRREGLDLERAMSTPWIAQAPFYSLGDGNRLVPEAGHYCRSATCLAGFRGRLASDYGTLGNLNTAWQTTLGSWDEATPASLEDALASGRYASWIDFRQYMDMVFTSIHTFARDLVKVQEPQARVGFTESAHNDLYGGYDWFQLANELDVLAARPKILSMEKVRSYCRPETTTGIVYDNHHGENPAYAHWLPWAALTHGMPTLWYDGPASGALGASLDGALTPDGRPISPFETVMGEVAEIKGGLASILLRAEREPAGIAIYDGSASAYLAAAAPAFGDARAAQASFAMALGDLAYSYDFIASARLVEGGLKPYKLLILPLARALSEREVKAIQAFRDAGGSVLADVAPGQFTEHGVPREAPALAAMFGVQWAAAPLAGEATAAHVSIGIESGASAGTFAAVVPDASASITDGAPRGTAGEVPVWIEKAGENGLALLSNHATPAYDTLPQDEATLWRDLLKDVLKRAGVEPVVNASGDNGAVLSGQVASFRYGSTRIITLLRDPVRGADTEKIDLPFDAKAVVYDLRTGERLSRPKKHSLRLTKGAAAAYACLPYDVTAIELEVPPSALPGRRIPLRVALQTKGGLPSEHVVRIDFGPYPGGPLAHYGQNAVCKDGRVDTYIALGHREKQGLYRVTAYDVLSGTFAEAMVKVEVDEPEIEPVQKKGKRG